MSETTKTDTAIESAVRAVLALQLRPGDKRFATGVLVRELKSAGFSIEQGWRPIEEACTGHDHPYAENSDNKFVELWNGYHVGIGYLQINEYGGSDFWAENGDPIEPEPTDYRDILQPPPSHTGAGG